MMKKLVIIVLLLFFFNLAIFGDQSNDSEQKEQRKCPRRVKVITKTVSPATFKEYKDLKKTIYPSKETPVLTKFSGIIKSIDKTEGDVIKSGESILTFETKKFEDELKVQKERVATWKDRLFKRKNWKTRSKRAEKQAEAVLNDAKNKVKELTDKIQNSTVIADNDGVIGKIKVNAGDLLSNNFEICSILHIDEMKINITDYSNKISDLQEVKVYVEKLSESYNAIAKKNDDRTTTLYISNTNNSILKGMTAKFTILIKEYKNAITLSKKLILKENSIRFVYIVNGKKAKKVVLDTGHIDKNGIVHITNGLKPNDRMIISELLSVKTGTVSNDLNCISDGKKIKPMKYNDSSGKYVKDKFKKVSDKTPHIAVDPKTLVIDKVKTENKQEDKSKIKKEVDKKQEEIDKKKETEINKKPNIIYNKMTKLHKRSFFGHLALGISLSYQKMSLANFEDIYGRMINPGLDLTININNKFSVSLSASYSSKTASTDWSTEEFKFTNLPINLDIRYKFARAGKLSFLGGAGITYYTFEDINPIETMKRSILGFNILAGTLYEISRTISLNMLVRMNFIQKDLKSTVFTPDNTLDLSSVEILFGISFKLGK